MNVEEPRWLIKYDIMERTRKEMYVNAESYELAIQEFNNIIDADNNQDFIEITDVI